MESQDKGISMQFIDLAIQQHRIKNQLDRNIATVLSHGQYINGPEVKAIEGQLVRYVGAKYAVGCASGTDALLLSLIALGVKTGDAIFTTPFTFIATAEVICLLGAIPIFVDVDPRTFNIDSERLDAAVQALNRQNRKLHPLPDEDWLRADSAKGIIAVDLFGLPAEFDRIDKIADRHSLFVIEDAAQSLGAKFSETYACTLADIGCTSFFPAKPLGCYGDGGMCFTDDETLAEVMDSLRMHGKGQDKYDNIRIGINGRLDTLQAAILMAKFEVFAEEIEMRQVVAARYNDLLTGGGQISVPIVPEGVKSAWAQYSILFESEKKRNSCQTCLKDAGIPTAIYYPKPLHLQTAFAQYGYKQSDFPVSEKLSKTILSLPMHPYLTREDQEKVAAVINAA